MRVALTDAAARLLGQRSPGRISGRDLAREAGVNYGLIHHYFGSKQALLQEGLASLAGSFAAGDPDGRWSSTEQFSVRHRPDYLHALAFASWAGQRGEVATIHPVAEASLADVARRRGGGEPDRGVRADVGLGIVFQLGYCLFEDLIVESLELEGDERTAVEERLRLVLRAILFNLDAGRAARGIRDGPAVSVRPVSGSGEPD